MSVLKFNDLVGGCKLRSKVVSIIGLGDVEVHELSAAEQWTVQEEIKASENQPGAWEKIALKWAARALSGPGKTATDEELDGLAKNVAGAVLVELFRHAQTFDYVSAEDARKNSSSDRTSDSVTD